MAVLRMFCPLDKPEVRSIKASLTPESQGRYLKIFWDVSIYRTSGFPLVSLQQQPNVSLRNDTLPKWVGLNGKPSRKHPVFLGAPDFETDPSRI